MIIGATPDSDYQILNLTQGLYHKYSLKRVFFLRIYPGIESALAASLIGHQAAAAAGTPAVSGRLAPALLWFSGGGAAG